MVDRFEWVVRRQWVVELEQPLALHAWKSTFAVLGGAGSQDALGAKIKEVLSSSQHPIKAQSGFAHEVGGFEPYPPLDMTAVDPSNLLVLDRMVEIYSVVKPRMLKPF